MPDSIESLVAAMSVKLDNVHDTCLETKQLITGNGSPEKGIDRRLVILEQSVSNCQKTKEVYLKDVSLSKKTQATIACSLITALAAIIVAVIAALH